ncbi:MAG: Sua5 family C-terminal domain-containing protein, partial [Alphaproteobacteria bacterium]
PTSLGIESTVIDLSSDEPALLRPGPLRRAEIEALTGPLRAPSGKIASPGMLKSHYAPEHPLRLNATTVAPNEALLAFGPDVLSGARQTLNLSARGDLIEAAANLFAYLRMLDASVAGAIAVMPIPEDDLGEAINDRLRRAAAPRGMM